MALITRTFLDKTNTIVYGDEVNLGMNPILELYYGNVYTRGLIHFNIDKLKKLIEDNTYPDITKLTHKLKMKNVASLSTPYSTKCNIYNNAIRAKSFDLVFFLIDKDWDMGGGFDFLKDGFNTVNRIYSTDGSNWFKANNMETWNENGIMSASNIEKNIIAKQHFDVGNESIDVDITSIVNDMILGNIENHGIGIAFCNEIESQSSEEINYVGFFTDHTHTFFHPYLETVYNDTIQDDRTNFYLDKDNKLYFYASVGTKMVNLDKLPTCSINGTQKGVKQATKGVYYIELNMDSNIYDSEMMFYDIWSNIYYKGKHIPDKELYFTTKSSEDYFSFGIPYETKKNDEIIPSISGINYKESILQGDIRKINIITKIPYTSKQSYGIYDLYYRLYVLSGDEEVTVIDWMPIDRGYNENYFLINTNELIPYRYFIDIKIKKDLEEKIYKKLTEFEIK